MSQSSALAGQNSADGGGGSQDRLQEICDYYRLPSPNYELLSDRRGGRTAWSCRVEFQGQVVPARYWYDGRNVYNAREDAAHEMLRWIDSKRTQAASGSPTNGH